MTRNTIQRFFLAAALLIGLSLPAVAQMHGGYCHDDDDGDHHGGYHFPGDSLVTVSASGMVMVVQDSLHYMPHYYLDTDSNGIADYWLHFGPYWYQPDSLSYPSNGAHITVSGGLIASTSPQGILVEMLNGRMWIDTTDSYDHGWHHGEDFGCTDSTHLYYDTLRQVQASGAFMIVRDTIFNLDQYFLDTDADDIADYWLHLGHPGDIPAGRTLPADGQSITVTGGLMPHGDPPGIMVLTIDGTLWRDSTWTGGHHGGWVGMYGGHIGTANGSWCSFPDSAWGSRMGGHMGGHRWSDSVFCEIDTTLPPHWTGGQGFGYQFIVEGSDGSMRMGHGHGGMMNFNLPVMLSLRYREGFFPDESELRLWRSNGEDWTVVQDASINTVTNDVTVEENPLYQYYVIAAASPAAAETAPAAASFRLEQNYPNPFSGATVVTFTLDRAMQVRLSVYDLSGRFVRTLVNDERTAGAHSITFQPGDLPSGTYILRMDTPAGSSIHRMQFIR